MLKSLLELLLSKFLKRADTEFMASQPMPKGWSDRIVIAQGLGSFDSTYTAPCSGYLCIDGGSKLSFVEVGHGPRSRQQVSNPTIQVHLAWPEVYVPVKKGDSCRYIVQAFEGNSNNTIIYFIPAIGGQTS